MKASQSNEGNEHRWKKWQGRGGSLGINLARARTCESRERTKRPAECPTSAGKPERHRHTGELLVCKVEHPKVACQAAVAVKVQGVHREGGTSADSERQRQSETVEASRKQQKAAGCAILESVTLLALSWM